MAKKPGGRIAPDGRPPQAKGVGENAKRHDLERPKTPGLHGSDLQKGDVQALEQGQRIAPAQTQQQAAPSPRQANPTRPTDDQTSPIEVPDAIEFLAERSGDQFNLPQPHRQIDNSRAMTWMPILRQLVTGPGSSGLFASLLIEQARKMQQHGGQPAAFVDMDAADAGIEAMLDVGLRSE